MHISVFALSVVLALSSAAAHAPDAQHRRHHARLVPADYHQALEMRELAGQAFNDTGPTEPTASSTGATSSASASSSQTSSQQAQSSSSSTAMSSSAASSSAPAPSLAPSSDADTSSSASSIPPPSSSLTTSSAAPITQSSTTSIVAPPSTISAPITQTITTTQSKPALVTGSKSSASASSSANALNAEDNGSSGGLSKGALIAIIVVAVVVGGAAIAFTLFRKFKLKKSSRFNSRMKSIDFGPGASMHDDFFEKTLQRSNSNSTFANQRNMLAAEVDATPNHVAGIPEHDFTAAPTHQQNAAGVYDMYNQDPYYHAEAYEYTDAAYGNSYSVTPGVGAYNGGTQADQLTQDQPINNGYADLQRGNSNGSGSGHGHGHQHTHAVAQPQVYPTEFPNPESYLGRPTGHGEGPYAQAAVYRGAY